MRDDMTEVWADILEDMAASLKHYVAATKEAFDDAVFLIKPEKTFEGAVFKGNEAALQTLADVALDRKRLAISDMQRAIQEFQHKLSKLESDALLPLQTGFIGKLMGATYHKANLEYGKCKICLKTKQA